MNDHAERLRHMAEGWLRAAEDVEKYRTTREEKINSGRYYRAQVAALLAGAEALEAMLPKQTSASGPAAQKVETLIFLADTADKLARLDCELIDRAAMAQRAALFRECAAMMRERGESGWAAQFEREYKGKTLAVVEAGPIGWYWYVDGSADYEAEIAPTLAAAQAAAVAWVDEQEGKDV